MRGLPPLSATADKLGWPKPRRSWGLHPDALVLTDSGYRPIQSIQVGDRVYAHSRDAIWTVLYVGGTATVPLGEGKVRLRQQTRYPWDGEVTIAVEPE